MLSRTEEFFCYSFVRQLNLQRKVSLLFYSVDLQVVFGAFILVEKKNKKLQKAPLTLTANSEPLVVTCKVGKRESNSAIDLLT